MEGIIYKATNAVNEKSYIGYTTMPFEKRKSFHLKDSTRLNGHFQKAIRKYGWNSFSWNIVETLIVDSKKELGVRESYWISFYDSANPIKGYNMTHGGDGGSPTEEVKKKISNSHKGKKFTEDHRGKISMSNKGRVIGERQRRAIGDAHRGAKNWNSKSVLCVETGKVYPYIQAASNELGIQFTGISRCCAKEPRYRTAGGFHWRYADVV